MLLGGLALSVWGGFKSRVVTSLIGLIVQGLGVIVVGLAPAALLWVGIAGIFVAGFMSPIINGPLMAIMQTSVAPEMQGRVFGLLNSAGLAATPIGLLIIGPLADLVGVQRAVHRGRPGRPGGGHPGLLPPGPAADRVPIGRARHRRAARRAGRGSGGSPPLAQCSCATRLPVQ